MRWTEALEQLGKDGYVVLAGGRPDVWIVEVLASQIGQPLTGTFEQAIGDIIFNPNESRGDGRSIANSQYEMNPHTDGSFDKRAPTDIILQCIAPDQPGYGDTVIVDTQILFARLSSHHLRALSRPLFWFARCERGKHSRVLRPVMDGSDGSVRYREDDKYVIETNTALGAEAIGRFRSLIRNELHQRRFALSVGDIVWMDNRRVLHGRTPLSGRCVRHLRRLRLTR
jgi:alpha-ketoglutarate-dependent taurine dioxygenase